MKKLFFLAVALVAMMAVSCGGGQENKIPDDFIVIDTTGYTIAVPEQFGVSYVEDNRYWSSAQHVGSLMFDYLTNGPTPANFKEYAEKFIQEKTDGAEPVGQPVVEADRVIVKSNRQSGSRVNHDTFFVVMGQNGKAIRGYVSLDEDSLAQWEPKVDIIINSIKLK